MIYDIVFMQGDDAHEVLAMIEDDGPDAALDHLMQCDYGDDAPTRDDMPHGPDDRTHEREHVNGVGGYLMSWHVGLGYVGLVRVEPTDDDII